MTYSEEYTTTTILDQDFGQAGNYPTAFGITFTPKVSGIALAILGAVGAVYVLLNFFLPVWDEYQKLKTDEAAKQQEVDQQKSGKMEIRLAEAETKLKVAEKRRQVILDLFGNSKDIKTILIDFNNVFSARDVTLLSFLPQGEPVVIGDDSLGAGTTNKLKRQTYQVSLRGNFGNTHNLIRDIERLQPLILIKDFKTDLAQPELPVKVVNQGGQVKVEPDGSTVLNSSMTLDVLLPLTPAEIAALAPPPPPPGQEGKPAEGQPPNPSPPPPK